jgi:hypothetical protein
MTLHTSLDGRNLMESISHDPAKVAALESMILQHPDQMLLDATHLINGGIYARTMFIPAGTVLTGALVEQDNTCVVYGDITVTTSEGAKRFTGHHTIKAFAGHKRAGFAHADTWWTALFRTDLQTVEEIEESLTKEADKLMTRKFHELPATQNSQRIAK